LIESIFEIKLLNEKVGDLSIIGRGSAPVVLGRELYGSDFFKNDEKYVPVLKHTKIMGEVVGLDASTVIPRGLILIESCIQNITCISWPL